MILAIDNTTMVTMTDYTITLQNVSKVFTGGYCAFSHLNFSLANKEKFCAIGREKDGKTTLIKLIAGLESPSEGAITLNGIDSRNIDYKTADIGCILPDMELKNNKRVFDILMYPLKIRKIEGTLAEAKVYSTAIAFGIDNLFSSKVSEISLYHRRLVALARLFVLERSLYLLDNPLEDLQYEERIRLASVLREVFKSIPAAVVYTCDLLDEAEELDFDRYGILGYAQMQDIGTLREMAQKPRTLESARLLYKNKINILECPILDGVVEILGEKSEYEFGIMSKVFSRGNLTFPYNAIKLSDKGRYSGRLMGVRKTLKGKILSIRIGDVELVCEDYSSKSYDISDEIRFDIDMERVNIYDISSDNIINNI